MSLKKGGAGESGFCYEAGASVEVAPEEALGSGGWGEEGMATDEGRSHEEITDKPQTPGHRIPLGRSSFTQSKILTAGLQKTKVIE